MQNKQYITLREAAYSLGISEGKITTLIDERKLTAYKIAGQYLRLKREDVENLKQSGSVKAETVKFSYTSSERLADFFLYNDFYLFSVLAILVCLILVFVIR